MTTSQSGIDFLKRHEGLRLAAYPDGNSYSIGYGHNGVAAGTVITADQAEQLLKQDLARFENAVNGLGLDLTQCQFDALVSLAYNAGPGAVQGTMAILLRQSTAPRDELRLWWTGHYITSKGERLEGLVRRRADEYALYCSGSRAAQGENAVANTVLIPAVGAVALLGIAACLFL